MWAGAFKKNSATAASKDEEGDEEVPSPLKTNNDRSSNGGNPPKESPAAAASTVRRIHPSASKSLASRLNGLVTNQSMVAWLGLFCIGTSIASLVWLRSLKRI